MQLGSRQCLAARLVRDDNRNAREGAGRITASVRRRVFQDLQYFSARRSQMRTRLGFGGTEVPAAFAVGFAIAFVLFRRRTAV